jgi:peptidoglycan/xylan/chitin deacetylase (PgdA/CDA1 family)
MTAAKRQLLIGLLAIPLSLLPFLAYGSMTPEGRMLTDQIQVRFDPPTLPRPDPDVVAALRAAAPSYEGRVMPLVYHGVGTDTAAEGDLAISPERFGEQLVALKAAGMHFVTARDVAEAFGGGRPLPPNAVLLTFDDGRADAVLWATRLLEQADAVATMFVITDATERPGAYYAGWDSLLSRDVWDLQSHTADLHHLQDTDEGRFPALVSRVDGESAEEWRDRVEADLDRADAALRDATGRSPVAFAYPFGAWGAEDRTNDPDLVFDLWAELAQHYRLAFHQDGQDEVALAGPETFPLDLRRLEVGDWSGQELVERIAAAAARTPGVAPG